MTDTHVHGALLVEVSPLIAMTLSEVTYSKTLLMLPVFPLTVCLTWREENAGLAC